MIKWSGIREPAGFVLLGIGAIGIFIPIWPTTPFVLLAAACFSSNPRLMAWLHRNKFFHDHIVNYKERTGLKPINVLISLVFLWATMCVSMVVIGKAWSVFLLGGVGIAVTVHILLIARPKRNRNAHRL